MYVFIIMYIYKHVFIVNTGFRLHLLNTNISFHTDCSVLEIVEKGFLHHICQASFKGESRSAQYRSQAGKITRSLLKYLKVEKCA
jgi:hypothetical protein